MNNMLSSTDLTSGFSRSDPFIICASVRTCTPPTGRHQMMICCAGLLGMSSPQTCCPVLHPRCPTVLAWLVKLMVAGALRSSVTKPAPAVMDTTAVMSP